MESRSKALAILLVTVFLICIIGSHTTAGKVQTRTLVVPDQYPTIQDAVGNASAGDNVYVKSGTYNITKGGYFSGSLHGFICLSIDKAISLIGEDWRNTILLASEDYPNPFDCGIVVRSANVTIEGFSIISNKNIIGLGENTIFAHNAVTLKGCTGLVAISTGGKAEIYSNVIEGVQASNNANLGTGILAADNSVIERNIIRYFGVGISVASGSSSQNLTILDNTIANNSKGVCCFALPGYLHNNNIVNSSQCGLYSEATGNVNATYNWWGTTNLEALANSITTGNHSESSIMYTPFLTQFNPTPNLAVPELPTLMILPLFAVAILLSAVFVRKRKSKK